MKHIKLSEVRDTALENAIEIEADNGETFLVLPPELWDDHAQQLVADDDNDPIAWAAIWLGGADRYEAFRAAGGTFAILSVIVGNNWGNVGESVASSNSSTSTVRPSKRTSSGTTGSGSKRILASQT